MRSAAVFQHAKLITLIALALGATLMARQAHAQATLSPGEPADNFTAGNWLANVSGPMDLVFLPDGRALVILKGGEIVVRTKDGQLVRNAAQVPVKPLDNEQGLLGVAAHPDFSSNKTVFLYGSIGETLADKNQIFTAKVGDDHKLTLDTAAPLFKFEGPHKHMGGSIIIHKRQLYIAIGDSGSQMHPPINKFASCLNKPHGKILRMELDGAPAADNPLSSEAMVTGCTLETRTTGAFGLYPPEKRVFAWGLRNPF